MILRHIYTQANKAYQTELEPNRTHTSHYNIMRAHIIRIRAIKEYANLPI